ILTAIASFRLFANDQIKNELLWINEVRLKMGLPRLYHDSALKSVAENQALYGLEHNQTSHEQHDTNSVHFKGKYLSDRLDAQLGVSRPLGSIDEMLSDYERTFQVFENTSSETWDIWETRLHVHRLLTAVYHRLPMLNPEFCMAGESLKSGVFGDMVHSRYAMMLGNSHCTPRGMDSSKPFYTYPYNNQTDFMPVFEKNETPDPLPNIKHFTGNPLTVKLNPSFFKLPLYQDIQLMNFYIQPVGSEGQLKTILKTNANDKRINQDEFVLFPEQPLVCGGEYQAYVKVKVNGSDYDDRWRFKTGMCVLKDGKVKNRYRHLPTHLNDSTNDITKQQELMYPSWAEEFVYNQLWPAIYDSASWLSGLAVKASYVALQMIANQQYIKSIISGKAMPVGRPTEVYVGNMHTTTPGLCMLHKNGEWRTVAGQGLMVSPDTARYFDLEAGKIYLPSSDPGQCNNLATGVPFYQQAAGTAPRSLAAVFESVRLTQPASCTVLSWTQGQWQPLESFMNAGRQELRVNRNGIFREVCTGKLEDVFVMNQGKKESMAL
ncbi:MAG: hypothetical protein ACR2PT_07915, partial [Endozoicomonas sp.]